ncbi:hypothetical protein PT281_05300 [Lactobacillus sp. ESL0701]|nr:hypothetical protein [Lactobacillus sp. ESL0701]MDF7672681.1 hypothetical protein [Lactobacillus sp. ESL0701]
MSKVKKRAQYTISIVLAVRTALLMAALIELEKKYCQYVSKL